jgi:hypothetical protein
MIDREDDEPLLASARPRGAHAGDEGPLPGAWMEGARGPTSFGGGLLQSGARGACCASVRCGALRITGRPSSGPDELTGCIFRIVIAYWEPLARPHHLTRVP